MSEAERVSTVSVIASIFAILIVGGVIIPLLIMAGDTLEAFNPHVPTSSAFWMCIIFLTLGFSIGFRTRRRLEALLVKVRRHLE